MKPIAKLWLIMCLFVGVANAQAMDQLPSWQDTSTKENIIAFVARVTDSASEDFVAPSDRIAVFVNDGTLWSEQPMYFQLAFALDRVKALAAQHPEWKTQQPFKAALEGDLHALPHRAKKACSNW